MKRYIVEFIGTFFFVLTIGCTVVGSNPGVIAPLAIATSLMVMIYAGGHVSGAHYNPAVTLAVWIRGKCPTSDLLPYVAAQLVGAVLGALVVGYLKGGIEVAAMTPDIPRALLSEFLFTFALAYVVLNVATAPSNANNFFYGLAIAGVVLAGAFSVGSISGGAFNPAVAVGISTMGLSSWENLWIFLVANFGGALVAGLLYNATSTD